MQKSSFSDAHRFNDLIMDYKGKGLRFLDDEDLDDKLFLRKCNREGELYSVFFDDK